MEHDLSLKKTIELKFEKKSVPIAKLPQVQNIFFRIFSPLCSCFFLVKNILLNGILDEEKKIIFPFMLQLRASKIVYLSGKIAFFSCDTKNFVNQ